MTSNRKTDKLYLSPKVVLLVLAFVAILVSDTEAMASYKDRLSDIAGTLFTVDIFLWIWDAIYKAYRRKHPKVEKPSKWKSRLKWSKAKKPAQPAAVAPQRVPQISIPFDIQDIEPEPATFADFGLYTPVYKFMDASQYASKLKELRERQKQMIRDKIACTFPVDIAYNGNFRQGAAIINDWIKLMLRAFNGESEAIILKARFDNVNALADKIRKSVQSINAIGKRMDVQITQAYVDLKVEELQVAYEYEVFKQQERERLRQIREEEREKAKVEKELRDKLAKLDKDLQHIQNEKQALQARIDEASEDDDVTVLQFELDKLTARESELNIEKDDIAEREVNARAGYVYIISNIGSFGENVYKIGMTRRLDPQERVDELGSASVPFTFDVHAFIFSTDAVALETALHHTFDHQRVNLVNPRKEFFAVTLDQIEAEVLKNFNGSVEFHRTAAADQYRESIELRKRQDA